MQVKIIPVKSSGAVTFPLKTFILKKNRQFNLHFPGRKVRQIPRLSQKLNSEVV